MYDFQCTCGRIHTNIQVLPLICRCGERYGSTVKRQHSTPRPKPKSKSSRYRSLQSWLNNLIGCGCLRADPINTLPQRLTNDIKLELTLEKAQEITSLALECYNKQFKDVAILTFHWNPHKFDRLKETFYEWKSALTHPVICYEFTQFSPEIDGSIVIQGTDDNLLWQKEQLVNIAISQLPDHIKYVAWIDHDLVFNNIDWLEKSIEKLDSGADVVQPFNKIDYLDKQGKIDFSIEGAVSVYKQGRVPCSAPGGAWVSTRYFLEKIGGLYKYNIVGGGDSIWFYGMTLKRSKFIHRYPPRLKESMLRWIDNIGPVSVDCLKGTLTHLWHGEKTNRQYIERDAILRKYNFDPNKHIIIDTNGLLKWSPETPIEFKQEVSNFFLNRRDDG